MYWTHLKLEMNEELELIELVLITNKVADWSNYY